MSCVSVTRTTGGECIDSKANLFFPLSFIDEQWIKRISITPNIQKKCSATDNKNIDLSPSHFFFSLLSFIYIYAISLL